MRGTVFAGPPGLRAGVARLAPLAVAVLLAAGPARACTIEYRVRGGGVERLAEGAAPVALPPEGCLEPPVRLRTGPAGTVVLLFREKRTLVRVDRNTELVLSPKAGDVRVDAGRAGLLSSVIGVFRIETPYVDAGIDGTEAVVHVVPGAGTVVATQEGTVTALSPLGPGLAIPAGTAVWAAPATAPRRIGPADAAALPPVFRPYALAAERATDWAVHLPPQVLADAADAGQAEAAALLARREVAAAEALLGCGAAGPGGTARDALCLMAAVALNRRERFPLVRPPAATPAYLVAESYARQAAGRLAPARAAAAAALAAAGPVLRPLALARLAELDLLLGDVRAGRRAAEAAEAAGLPLGTALRGFAALASLDPAAAEALFARAIAAGEASPLPLLGRGLARIRQDRLAEGRADLEAAALSDPLRADLRTWLGRAYLAEGRTEKARAQFAEATRRDPDDPLPFLFGAMERFDANDPVQALRLLGEAEARVPGRGTLRSTAGLGEDRAVIAAATGRVEEVLGFQDRALRSATRAVEGDPTSPAAHRFLADALRDRPGSEIARASAYLRYQLLSPPNADPIEPDLGEVGLALLDTTGPARATLAEFAPLFATNGPHLDLTLEGGTQGTIGGTASFVVLHDTVSFGLAHYSTRTDGFRTNNDVRHDVATAQLKLQVTPELSLFGEARWRDTEAGDRQLEFNLAKGSRDLRTSFSNSSLRAGVHWRPGRGIELLGFLAVADEDEGNASLDPVQAPNSVIFRRQGIDAQVAAFIRSEGFDISLGLEHYVIDLENDFRALPDSTGQFRYTGFWGQLELHPVDWADMTLGASLDVFDGTGSIRRNAVSPRLGLVLEPVDGLRLRAVHARTLSRFDMFAASLAPATIAGFDVTWRDVEGVLTEITGLGVTAELPWDTTLDAEVVARRRLQPTSGRFGTISTEDVWSVELSRTFGASLAVSLGLSFLEGEGDGSRRFDRLRQVEIPLRLRWFHPSGFYAGADAVFVHHAFQVGKQSRGSSDNVVLNASLGWRLPGNRATVSLEVFNAFGAPVAIEEQDIAVATATRSRFAREAVVLATVRARF